MKTKEKTKSRPSFRFTIAEWSVLATFFLTTISFVVAGVKYFNDKFASIDLKFERIDYQFKRLDGRFEQMERRFDEVDSRLDKIGADLSKTSDLLGLYLTWRFIYVNDPVRKNIVPLYDPRTRTLEFIDKNK